MQSDYFDIHYRSRNQTIIFLFPLLIIRDSENCIKQWRCGGFITRGLKDKVRVDSKKYFFITIGVGRESKNTFILFNRGRVFKFLKTAE